MLYYCASFMTGARMEAISLPELHQRICAPEAALAEQVALLRRIRQLDQEAYRRAKARLPWFIGASFGEQIRRMEQFQRLDYVVVDLDHCYETPDELEALRIRVRADDRVCLAFVSPGGDGLKCVFRLAAPITHTKLYSDFYRTFAADFAASIGKEKHVDLRTCDATRVCFLSADPGAYLQADACPVSWEGIAHANLLPVSDDVSLLYVEEPTPEISPAASESAPAEKSAPVSLPPEVYAEIRRRLNPGKPVRPAPQVFVPEILYEKTEPIRLGAAELGVTLTEVRDIQYGRKLIFSFREAWAEINVFYGKSGFSVVKSPKRGSDPELCDLMHTLVSQLIFQPENLSGLRAQITRPPSNLN